MTLEKGEHGSNRMRNGLGQTISLVQQNYIKKIGGWYWRDIVIFNETLNNDVTVFSGLSLLISLIKNTIIIFPI